MLQASPNEPSPDRQIRTGSICTRAHHAEPLGGVLLAEGDWVNYAVLSIVFALDALILNYALYQPGSCLDGCWYGVSVVPPCGWRPVRW